MDIKELEKNILLANEQIKNGIEENGIIRDFDIVDFCILFKIEVKEVIKVASKVLSQRDFNTFKNIVTKYKSFEIDRDYDIAIVLNSISEINCKKDEKGNLIIGSGEVLSKEFKQDIFNYLKSNSIAANLKTYRAIIKRYSNGTFLLDDMKLSLENKDNY